MTKWLLVYLSVGLGYWLRGVLICLFHPRISHYPLFWELVMSLLWPIAFGSEVWEFRKHGPDRRWFVARKPLEEE